MSNTPTYLNSSDGFGLKTNATSGKDVNINERYRFIATRDRRIIKDFGGCAYWLCYFMSSLGANLRWHIAVQHFHGGMSSPARHGCLLLANIVAAVLLAGNRRRFRMDNPDQVHRVPSLLEEWKRKRKWKWKWNGFDLICRLVAYRFLQNEKKDRVATPNSFPSWTSWLGLLCLFLLCLAHYLSPLVHQNDRE